MSDTSTLATFPLPPMHYVCKYTDENVKSSRIPKPPPPPKDAYCMFGVEYRYDDQIIRPLEAQNILRLHPHNYDHRRELKKLNFSIVANFIDLIQLLVQSPDSPRRLEKIDDLTLLFIHMHHLINEFRPHQARESLRVMLENQKRNRLEIVNKFEECLSQVVDLLNNTITTLPSSSQLDTKLTIPKNHYQNNNKNINNNNKSSDFGMVGATSNGLKDELYSSPVILDGVAKLSKCIISVVGGEEGVGNDENVGDQMMCDIVDALN